MDSSLRASAFAGIGAFILSGIVAAFSRVSFGALVLRALLSGLLFAGIVYAAQLLLKRFVPELFDGSEAPRSDQGRLVDIVLPGGEAEPSGVAPIEPSAPIVSADSAQALVGDAPGNGEIEREVADIRADRLLSSDPGTQPESPGGGLAPNPSIALDSLDTLPDLDGLSGSFTEGHAGGADGGSEGVAAQMGVSDSMPTAGSPSGDGQDPALLAKAVQTLLRRDQKGQ